MRVLVTGPTGFIGQHVVKALQSAGHSVVGVCRHPVRKWSCDWITADILDPSEAKRVAASARAEVVVHLAWTTEHGKFWNDPANAQWAKASIDLADAAFANGARRFCGVGTCFEYDFPEAGDCDEVMTPLADHLPYDTAKASFRRKLLALAEETGASTAWARVFHLYGPDENPNRLVPSVARSIASGQVADCSSGKVLRDFIDSRDAGAAIAALTVSEVTGDVNIGSGERATVAEVAKLIGELSGRPDLVRVGALPDRPNDPPRITAAVNRLRDEVGFASGRTLRSGLSEAVAYWNQHVKSGAGCQAARG